MMTTEAQTQDDCETRKGNRAVADCTPWIFIHDTDEVEAGLMVLFFGLVFSVASPTPGNFLTMPFIVRTTTKNFSVLSFDVPIKVKTKGNQICIVKAGLRICGSIVEAESPD